MYEKSWMGKTLRERGLEDQKEGPSEAFGRQVLEGSRKAVGRESGAASAVLAAMGDGGGGDRFPSRRSDRRRAVTGDGAHLALAPFFLTFALGLGKTPWIAGRTPGLNVQKIRAGCCPSVFLRSGRNPGKGFLR